MARRKKARRPDRDDEKAPVAPDSLADLIPPTVRRWLGPGVLAVVGAAALIWSWGTWPDVLVDFGKELYLAWRLAEGDVLYRDLAYFHGPLPQYVNALWFDCSA